MSKHLSALETAFLGLESAEVPFVFASILELDRPIARDALRAHVDAALVGVPRYRQALDRRKRAWIATEFDIARHVHAISVAEPGGREELEGLVARLLSDGIPPHLPPWQVWTVSGLAGGRGAVIALVHHALADGIAGFRLLEYVLSAGPIEAPPPDVAPPKLGSLRRLFAWKNVRALGRLLREGLQPASPVGLNPRRTSHLRAVASHTVALDDVASIQHAFDATNNDVVLATVALGLRRFLARRGIDPDGVRDARAMVPVGRHAKGERVASGNRVALMLAKLPVDEADPAACVGRISKTTRAIKAARTVGGGDLLVALGDATTPAVLLDVLRVALWMRAFNVLVTNVPGPRAPLTLLGATLVRIVPIVNLWPHQGLAIAVASYAGTMTFGFQVDRAVIADAGPVRDDFAAAFQALLDRAHSGDGLRSPQRSSMR